MKRKLSKALVASVCTSVGLLAASAGIVFGISAGMYKVSYMDLENMQIRINSALNQGCYNQNIISKWNMRDELNPMEQNISEAKWKSLCGNDVPMPAFTKKGEKVNWDDPDAEAVAKAKWRFATMSIDGSTHATLDRSFNQGLYNGIINFIQGKDISGTLLKSDSTVEPTTVLGNYTAASFKPAEDNNNGLTSTYKAIASDSTPFRILGLAGFNHVSPLGDLGTNDESGRFVFGTQFTDLKKMLMLLIDGSVANNQAISSVLFRADQPGFLAGLSTCMYFYNNLHMYHKGYKDISFGLYGGNPIPTVCVYLGGLQRGIEFFNRFVLYRGLLNYEFASLICDPDPSLEPAVERIKDPEYKDLKNLLDYSKYKNDIYSFLEKKEYQTKPQETKNWVGKLYEEYKIRQIKLGQYATHFTGSFNSGDAIGITKQYLTRGASAIVAVAGPQSLDSAQEIQNQGSECIVVGVDSAMENGQYQRKHTKSGLEDKDIAETYVGGEYVKSEPKQKDNIIKFSAVKDITTVTKKFSDLCTQNKNFDVEQLDASGKGTGQPDPQRSICGVGYQTCGNILNGLISISFDGWHPLVQAMKHVVTRDGVRTLEQSWASAAMTYVSKEPGASLPEKVKSTLTSLVRLDTYNPDLVIGDSKDDTISKYYPHITGILGILLGSDEYKLDFSGMSVIPTKFDAAGNAIEVKEATGEEAKMTILDWLKNNMYFTC